MRASYWRQMTKLAAGVKKEDVPFLSSIHIENSTLSEAKNKNTKWGNFPNQERWMNTK